MGIRTQHLMLDGTKIALYADRVKKWEMGERVAPITVDMALTRACNYSCIYCYGQLQENPRHAITAEVISRCFKDFADIGVKGVSLVSDGESTCSPHLVHAVTEARKNNLAIALGTNGALLSHATLIQIMSSLSYLRFNISAGTKEAYNRIMRPKDAYAWERVMENLNTAVLLKRINRLPTTIGMQMVLMPEFAREILPLARLASRIGVDYLVIKHCSDDEKGSLGVDYSKYALLEELLKEAESLSTEKTRIIVKWSKLQEGNLRTYKRCYAPPFQLQISGSGLVAPCGMFFGSGYSDFHIGNICETSFKEIWQSERYWEVMNRLSSLEFNAQTDCGCLCLQHSLNKALFTYLEDGTLPPCNTDVLHKEFV